MGWALLICLKAIPACHWSRHKHHSPGLPWAYHKTTKLVMCSESFGVDAAECKQFCLCITKILCLLMLRLILISLHPTRVWNWQSLDVQVLWWPWTGMPDLSYRNQGSSLRAKRSPRQQRSCSLYERVSTQSAGCPCLTRLSPRSFLSWMHMGPF